MGVPLYVPAGKPATGGTLEVTITIDVASEQRNGHNIVLNQHIPINSTATVPFLFPSSLTPNTKPYSVSCVAKNAATGEEFTASADLLYLPPNPYGGAAIKMDLLTGAFLGKPTGGGGSKASAAYGPIFPFGFYTDYGATETNLDLLNTVKSEGSGLFCAPHGCSFSTDHAHIRFWIGTTSCISSLHLMGSYHQHSIEWKSWVSGSSTTCGGRYSYLYIPYHSSTSPGILSSDHETYTIGHS